MATDILEPPGTVLGPDPQTFTLKFPVINWLKNEILHRRKENPDIPIVLMGKSAWGGVAPELGDWVDGLLLISPTHPLPNVGFDHSYATLLQQVNFPLDPGNPNIMNFHSLSAVNNELSRVTWVNMPHPFLKTPTLIMTGPHDPETTLNAKRYYSGEAPFGPFGASSYLDIKGAGHNVFDNDSRKNTGSVDSALTAYVRFYEFLNFIATTKINPQ